MIDDVAGRCAAAMLVEGLAAKTADGKPDNNALRSAALKALRVLSPELFEALDP